MPDMLLTTRFIEALTYAAVLHADQKSKGKDVPYIAHLLGVTSIALDSGADEDQAIAALLHDAVEDQGGRNQLETIRNRFGDKVARIVEDCSDSFSIPKPPWGERKKAYLEHLQHIGPDSLLVSAADKLYNARSILQDHRKVGEKVWGRFKGGHDGSLWYYRELVTRYRQMINKEHPSELSRLVDELDLVVTDLEKLDAGI